ncbi:MAG: TerC family protein, partial [Steroidobacteraceae bacterium]
LFLMAKSVSEIHNSLEGPGSHGVSADKLRTQVLAVIVQIGIVDIIFSLDSVLTAIGLANHVGIMVAAIVGAVLVMMFMAAPIHEFIERHPTIKILALSFLILVGIALVGESFDMKVPKGYLYFAMAFSVCVEMVNIRMRRKGPGAPVELRELVIPGDD